MLTRRVRESLGSGDLHGARAGWEAGGWLAAVGVGGGNESTLGGIHLSCPLTFEVNVYLLLTLQRIGTSCC